MKLEDLPRREAGRAAIKTEAEVRASRVTERGARKPTGRSPRCSPRCATPSPTRVCPGSRCPGWTARTEARGAEGPEASTGGVSLGGGGDDDDDSEDDDDDPRNEGLEDDDDGSLNDDELMKEYMREMVKDGTAEDALLKVGNETRRR